MGSRSCSLQSAAFAAICPPAGMSSSLWSARSQHLHPGLVRGPEDLRRGQPPPPPPRPCLPACAQLSLHTGDRSSLESMSGTSAEKGGAGSADPRRNRFRKNWVSSASPHPPALFLQLASTRAQSVKFKSVSAPSDQAWGAGR